jgi:hypothetical protein
MSMKKTKIDVLAVCDVFFFCCLVSKFCKVSGPWVNVRLLM